MLKRVVCLFMGGHRFGNPSVTDLVLKPDRLTLRCERCHRTRDA